MAWIPAKNWGFVSLGNSENAVYVHEILLHHLVDNIQSVQPQDRFDFDAGYLSNALPDLHRLPCEAIPGNGLADEALGSKNLFVKNTTKILTRLSDCSPMPRTPAAPLHSPWKSMPAYITTQDIGRLLSS